MDIGKEIKITCQKLSVAGREREKKNNRAAQSNPTQHAWHVASMGTSPDQANATGIQIMTKITDSREQQSETAN